MPTEANRVFEGDQTTAVPAYSTVSAVKINGVAATYTIENGFIKITTPVGQGDLEEIVYESFRPADVLPDLSVMLNYRPAIETFSSDFFAPSGFTLLLGADGAQLLGADGAPLYGVA